MRATSLPLAGAKAGLPMLILTTIVRAMVSPFLFSKPMLRLIGSKADPCEV
jgi:hypothetical protein